MKAPNGVAGLTAKEAAELLHFCFQDILPLLASLPQSQNSQAAAPNPSAQPTNAVSTTGEIFFATCNGSYVDSPV